ITLGQGAVRLGDDSLIDGPLGVVGRDVDADLGTGGGDYFDGGLPVGPAVGAGGDVGQIFTVVFTPAVAVGIDDTRLVQQRLGALDVVAGPLQVGYGVVVKHGLLAGGRIHQRPRKLVEGGRLVGHGV